MIRRITRALRRQRLTRPASVACRTGAVVLLGATLSFSGAADEIRLCAGESPAVSPDGTRVAFTQYADGVQRLGVIDRATREIVWIEAGPGMSAYPTWLPQGDLVYMWGDDRETAYAAWKSKSSVGYHLRRFANGVKTDLTSGHVRDYLPVAAPDGRTVYFTTTRWVRQTNFSFSIASTSMIGALDLVTGETRLVVDSPRGNNSGVANPAVSPDGKILVWAHLNDFFDAWRIYGAKLSDTSPDACAPFTPDGLVAHSPAWHPDGSLICFTGFRRGDPGWGVWVEDVKTGFVRRLCTGENPRFAPDGKGLVFARDRSVYYRTFDAVERPAAPLTADRPTTQPPERVLGRWTGNWTKRTVLPLDGTNFVFGAETPFFVRARVRTDGARDRVRQFVIGEYAEAGLGFQLYRKADPWFATRKETGTFAGTYHPGALPAGEHVMTGGRLGDVLYVSVDGARPRLATCADPIALDHPKCLIVAPNLRPGEAVLSVEVGTGYPANVKKAMTREEVMK